MKTNQNGFTLIELLVSVAIIGILVAIAVPNFKEFRRRAYDVKTVSLAQEFVMAIEAHDPDENFTRLSLSSFGGASNITTQELIGRDNLDPDFWYQVVFTPIGDADGYSVAVDHCKGKVFQNSSLVMTYEINSDGKTQEERGALLSDGRWAVWAQSFSC